MKTRFLYLLTALMLCTAAWSQKRYNLAKWDVPAANYSGITPIGNDQYAVVSDEEQNPGFYIWNIQQDAESGKILQVTADGYRADAKQLDRDAEGIAYCPTRGTIFISGEADQRIMEHRLDGMLTAKELPVPVKYSVQNIQPNRGFEALGHDTLRHLFWTTTESPVKGDPARQLQLLQYNDDLQLVHTFDYQLDEPQAKNAGRDHYHGVVAITPLSNGRLLILERECRIAKNYNGSKCWCRLYEWSPTLGTKRLIEQWRSKFTLTNTHLANYEGMCLGKVLNDGRQSILLVSDSQAGYGRGRWHLKDYLKVIILPENIN